MKSIPTPRGKSINPGFLGTQLPIHRIKKKPGRTAGHSPYALITFLTFCRQKQIYINNNPAGTSHRTQRASTSKATELMLHGVGTVDGHRHKKHKHTLHRSMHSVQCRNSWYKQLITHSDNLTSTNFKGNKM
jgi:hypothetical protein